jgi:hypothetical protein
MNPVKTICARTERLSVQRDIFQYQYMDLPGTSPIQNIAKMRARAYTTIYKCEQCTIEKGYNFWLCHTTKKVDGLKIVVDCHTKYHVQNNLFEGGFPLVATFIWK